MELGIDQIELEVLVKYVVNDDELSDALAVVKRFKNNEIAMGILRNYYTDLPEAREEMVCDMKVVAEKQGVFLYGLKTTGHTYLYLGSTEEVLYVGDYDRGLKDEDTLLYFGYKNEKDFLDQLPCSFEDLESVTKSEKQVPAVCVVCGVSEGELHIFGCPVEQCPWCDGQLNRCNCRFDQLGVDEIENGEQLELFEELLAQKGRIAFENQQSPAYPTAGGDPGPLGEKKLSE